jgi:DNA mismatch repair protein MutS2
MKYFLTVANKRTLLLLDEFGTGSDPELGGALAEVFFEELYQKKSYAVITTHYATIKLLADRLVNAVNGCMLFNTATLEPLYKFSMGQPGSSFTFEVAQMNGISTDVIEKAKSKLDGGRIHMDKLLSELNKEKMRLQRLNQEHEKAKEHAQNAEQVFLEKKEKFEERLKTQQDFIERNNVYLNSGKKMKSFIDRYVTITRKKDPNKQLFEDVRKYLLVEKSKIEESKRKLELVKAAAQPIKKVKKPIPQVDTYQRDKIVVGSTVKMIETRQSGTVEEINRHLITVTFGFMRLKVEREKLMWVK